MPSSSGLSRPGQARAGRRSLVVLLREEEERHAGHTQKHADAGDVWTWTAIDADSKLCISFLVGARDGFCAELLMRDLESRIASDRTQLTTDQLNVYLRAVDLAFKGKVDYAMLHKVYAGVQDGRYSPAEGGVSV